MKVVGFNDRFEISESRTYKGIFKIYDFNKSKEIGILFDRISEAIKWLESKGFVRTNFED